MYIYKYKCFVTFLNNKQQYGNAKTLQGDVQLWASLFCLNILVYTFYFVYLY